MYILMISRGIPSDKDPQWGCFEQDQAEALAALGHKVVVASVDGRLRFYYRKIGITTVKKNGVIYYNSFIAPVANIGLSSHSLSRRVREWQLERIYKMVEKTYGKPDVVYGQYFFISYTAIRLCQKHNLPLVTIEHAGRFREEKVDRRSLKYSRELYKYTAANIAVSHSLANALKKLFGIDCYVIHNVYSKEFQYFPQEKKHSETVRFISTGSLVPIKCHNLLIEAFAKFGQSKDNWELNIIGDGVCRKSLQQQIEQSGLTEHIHLAGRMPKSKIVNILNASDVYVLSSRIETFSVASIEALACGLPVIATRCGGPEEFMNENNGLLVPVNDADALAKGIGYMYEHYRDYDRQAIADDCKARFSAEVIAGQLTEIFEEVIAGKNRKDRQ